MRKLRRGDCVRITKPLLIRRKNGCIESYSGRKATITQVELKYCQCDVGLEKPVLIPTTHLEKIA